jgi:DNA-binding NtrC family response regulator
MLHRNLMTLQPRVLVVDDDLAMREVLVSLLEEQGLCVRSAASAQDARRCMTADDFDVVLSDIHMPVENGQALLGALCLLHPEVPVILMTGFAATHARAEALHAGAFDLIAKPFRRRTLMTALERALEQRRLPRKSASKPRLHPESG